MRRTRRSIEKVIRHYFAIGLVAATAALYGCPQFALSGLLSPSIIDVNVEEPATVVVGAGTTFQLAVTGVTEGGERADISDIAQWNSSDSSVVSVVGDGTLYAAGLGESQVRAVLEGYADGITVVVETNGAPPAPATVVVTQTGPTLLHVQWEDVTFAEGYEVYYDTAPGGTFAAVAYSGTGTSFVDNTLGPGQVRYYRAHATNIDGASAPSAPGWARTYFNGDFELGDLSGWTLADIGSPFLEMQVVDDTAITPWYGNPVVPIEGSYTAINGFDGGGPDTITLGADIDIGPSSSLEFDYRLGFDLAMVPASVDRTFQVKIRAAGGGGVLANQTIYTATAGVEQSDTGWLSGLVDVSGFAHTTVWVEFLWDVPESFSGPAEFQLDDVRLQ